jgi:tRNA-dihydrouridine synthase
MQKIYLAPMEGVTTHIYRRIFNKYYNGVDKYFTPFLSPNQNKSFQMKELEEIDNEKNAGMRTVPQLLCCNADHFIWACREIAQKGYNEVNFNLGCPSNTVVTKKKGSGFLYYPDELDEFFEKVFEGIQGLGIRVSVKTRLGKHSPEEFVRILGIYNRYPIKELIVHPRIQKDFYKGDIRQEWLDYAYIYSDIPICINGDIFLKEDLERNKEKFPEATAFMLGRGLIARPYLLTEGDKLIDKERFKNFNEDLLDFYCERMSGDFSILCKLKELWYYMLPALNVDKDMEKRLKKTGKVVEYRNLINEIINSAE